MVLNPLIFYFIWCVISVLLLLCAACHDSIVMMLWQVHLQFVDCLKELLGIFKARLSRWHRNRHPSMLVFTQKINNYSFYLLGSANKFQKFCALPLFVSKNGRNSFSQPFCSCRICINSDFPNFWPNHIWQILFLKQGCRWWQYGTLKWNTIRKSLGTTVLDTIALTNTSFFDVVLWLLCNDQESHALHCFLWKKLLKKTCSIPPPFIGFLSNE